MLTETQPIVK